MKRVSACLIVKDEEKFIERCLKSLLNKVDEIVVVDTGSTDKTIEIVKSMGIPVYHYQWCGDFSAARNFSIEKATGNWILIIDADEILCSPEDKQINEFINSADMYTLKLHNLLGENESSSDVSFTNVVRLFKNVKENRYSGKIHEQIASGDPNIIIESSHIEIIHFGYQEEVRKQKNKFQRNVQMLEDELNLMPDNGFHWFNLGMEYQGISNKYYAIECYENSYRVSDTNVQYFPRLLRNLALCYYDVSQYERAIEICKEAISYFPDYPDIWYIKALVLRNQQNFIEAMSTLEHVLTIGETQRYWSEEGTGSYKAIYTFGEILLTLGKEDQAIGMFELGTAYYPHVFAFYPQLSSLYIKKSNLQAAVKTLQKGAEYHPNLGEIALKSMNLMKRINLLSN